MMQLRVGKKRLPMGRWVCPSGNHVEVSLDPVPRPDGTFYVWYAWDEAPPLLPQDREYYLDVIRPALERRFEELTGQRGAGFVVSME